ncbi:MAG: hypothetical protein ACP5N2_05885 [Candidatus Nanoarchaeia archaeon]
MVEVKITYDTLFDLLRREKSRSELQQLDKTFYTDVISYIKEKRATLRDEDHHTLLFPKSEQEKIKIQIKNIQKIIRELYELREKKIINLAVNKVRTESNLIDTSSLLPEEIGLFNETCDVLSKYKSGLLNQVLRMEVPSIAIQEQTASFSTNQRESQTSDEKEEIKTAEYNKSIFDMDKKEETERTNQDDKITNHSDKMIRVKVMNDLPKFLGQDKNIYGPYKKDDLIELPESLTNILTKKGRVEIQENS